jgi:hypothetical protein
MLATFAIEITLAVYTIWRYKLNEVSRLVVAILFFLAVFQLAEYMVCGGLGADGLTWSRIGYVAITILPPLGIHLAVKLANKKLPWLLWLAYGSAAAFVAFFALAANSITGNVCQGNYVIFDVAPGSSWLYGLYYYSWIIISVWLSWRWAKSAGKKAARALRGLAVGYLAFLLPTTTVNFIDPSTLSGIPSIMCGFAVLLAITLVFWVLPAAGTKRKK